MLSSAGEGGVVSLMCSVMVVMRLSISMATSCHAPAVSVPNLCTGSSGTPLQYVIVNRLGALFY